MAPYSCWHRFRLLSVALITACFLLPRESASGRVDSESAGVAQAPRVRHLPGALCPATCTIGKPSAPRRSACTPHCPACTMHAASAPTLYASAAILEGIGTSVGSAIWPMAFAAWRGFNFGGLLGRTSLHSSHGVGHAAAFELVLGTSREPVLVADQPPAREGRRLITVDSAGALYELGEADVEGGVDVYCGPACGNFDVLTAGLRLFWPWEHGAPDRQRDAGRLVGGSGLLLPPSSAAAFEDFLATNFSAMLRQGAECGLRAVPRSFTPRHFMVAMHIRRGDIDVDSQGGRFWLSYNYYLELAARLRELMPTADVHVFSEACTYHLAPCSWIENRTEGFDALRRAGLTLHLDGDPFEAWAHMASAQVLVMGASAFSSIPALLNRNCVIMPPYAATLRRGGLSFTQQGCTSCRAE